MKLAFIIFTLTASVAFAATPRSTTARHQFVKETACPATGNHRMPYPGWQIDHIIPLKCNDPDEPSNMQWLTIEDHKAKTKREANLCRKAKSRK